MEKTAVKLILLVLLCAGNLFADQTVLVDGTAGSLIRPTPATFRTANSIPSQADLSAAIATGTAASISGTLPVTQVTGTAATVAQVAAAQAAAIVASGTDATAKANAAQAAAIASSASALATGSTAIVAQIPTNNNQLANGAGYVTASGSTAFAATSGTAASLSGTIGVSQVTGTAGTLANIATAQSAAISTASTDATSKANAAQAFAIQRANHTGTQTASTISDFAATVATLPAATSGSSTVSGSAISAGSGGGLRYKNGTALTAGVDSGDLALNYPDGTSLANFEGLFWPGGGAISLADSGGLYDTTGDHYVIDVDGLHGNINGLALSGSGFTLRTLTSGTLPIGSAAFVATSTLATSTQGTKADTAIQTGTSTVAGLTLAPSGTGLVLSGTPALSGTATVALSLTATNAALYATASGLTAETVRATAAEGLLLPATGGTATGLTLGGTTTATSNSFTDFSAGVVAIPHEISAIPDLQMWLAADDLALSNSSTVTTWFDRTKYHNDVTPISGGTQYVLSDGINGRPTVVFTGSCKSGGTPSGMVSGTTMFNSTWDTAFSAFVVCRKDSLTSSGVGSGTGMVWSVVADPAFHSGGEAFIYCADYNNTAGGGSNARHVVNVAGSLTLDGIEAVKPNIYAATYNGAQMKSWLNGKLVATGTTSTTLALSGKLFLGWGTSSDAFFSYNGRISEVLIFKRGLTTQEAQTVNRYLANKYAMTGRQIVWDGHSQVYAPFGGLNGALNQRVQALMPSGWSSDFVGQGGQTVSYFNSLAHEKVDGGVRPNVQNVAVLEGCENDILAHTSAATIYANYTTWCNERHTAGYATVLSTPVPTFSGTDTVAAGIFSDINAMLISNTSSIADAVVNLTTVPQVTGSDANLSATYFAADHVHLLDAAYQLITPLFVDAIQRSTVKNITTNGTLSGLNLSPTSVVLGTGTLTLNASSTANLKTVSVANRTARLALTSGSMHVGDTVLQQETPVNVYRVIDATQLSSDAGYSLEILNSSSDVSVGQLANGSNNGTAVGAGALGKNFGTGIGQSCQADNGIAVGNSAIGSGGGVAIGFAASALGTGNIAIANNGATIPGGWTNTTEIGAGTASLQGGLNFRGFTVMDSVGSMITSGTNNLMPNQLASSGSSVMTRALGDARWAQVTGTASASVNFGTVLLDAVSTTQTVAVSGCAVGDTVQLGLPADGGQGNQKAWVSTSGTVSINSFAAVALTSTAQTYYIITLKHP